MLAKTLAVDYPHDYNLQYLYAQTLASSGDYDAAYAWLNRVLVPEAKWEPSERSLPSADSTSASSSNKAVIAIWPAILPPGTRRTRKPSNSYGQYLSALVRSNQADKAEAFVAQWLREGQVTGELPNPSPRGCTRPSISRSARVTTSTPTGSRNAGTHRWLGRPCSSPCTTRILTRPAPSSRTTRFRQTDAGREARQNAGRLPGQGHRQALSEPGHPLVDWVWSDSGLEQENWKKLADRLRKRWDAEKKPEIKHQFAQSLVRILGLLNPEDTLAFLRIQWKQGPEAHRVEYANQLFTFAPLAALVGRE